MAPGKRSAGRKLTAEQETDLLRRHALHLANSPKAIARDFGVTVNTVANYVRRSRGLNA